MRNSRNQIRKKLQEVPGTSNRASMQQARIPEIASKKAKIASAEEEYNDFIDEIKLKMTKKNPSMEHLFKFLKSTFDKRHKWIDRQFANDLTLRTTVDKFPLFKRPDVAIEELKLLLGSRVSEFAGSLPS